MQPGLFAYFWTVTWQENTLLSCLILYMLGYSSLASILTFSHLPGELLFIIQE